MHALTGYVDRWSVKPGGAIRFMVSSAGGRDFTLRFVRHICADPNPAGPGYAEIPMPSALDRVHPGKEQPAYLGSFGQDNDQSEDVPPRRQSRVHQAPVVNG